MSGRRKVLSSQNGNLDSLVVFVAEAPGRLGANKYGIPLFGDQTGRNFEWLISGAGISRDMIFITNAVLCNPRDTDGRNDTPTANEILNCSIHLSNTLDTIKPKYIVPLGKAALNALKVIHPLQVELGASVGHILAWNGYQLYPLYHPGPRAFIWRSKAQQVKDYEGIKCLMEGHNISPLGQLNGN